MTVEHVLQGRDVTVVTCAADASIAEAVKLLAERRIGAMPVLDGGAIVGILSERDILYRLAEQGSALLDRRVAEVMTTPAVTVDPGTSALAALSLMTRRRIRHLPVLVEGKMVGFVSIGDLVKFRIDRIESEAEAMRSYIQTA